MQSSGLIKNRNSCSACAKVHLTRNSHARFHPTSKGQTTIPKEFRERLGLKPGDKLTFTTLSDGTIVMRAKTRRLLDLVGGLTRPGQPSVSVGEMSPFYG
ncbi:MAG TPA: AbrB/MazE/SpoVT family DNA-binding domain-containing protein [Roseateles sp.]